MDSDSSKKSSKETQSDHTSHHGESSTYSNSHTSNRATLLTDKTDITSDGSGLATANKSGEILDFKLLFEAFPTKRTIIKRELKETSYIVKDYNTGIGEIVKQREQLVQHQGVNFTMMVAGQIGVGKTTFVNTLFKSEILDSFNKNISSSSFCKPTKTISCAQLDIVCDKTKLHLNIIDTPGFGDKINNSFSWVSIINFLDHQMRSLVFQEEQPNRRLLKDNRIHCCLYFLEPTNKGLSPLDITTMKDISKRVNLIPVIGKADCLNKKAIQNFKEEIRSILETYEIHCCQLLDDENPDFAELFNMIPFSVISSESYVSTVDNRKVRGREYKWGTVEVENPNHSDFTKLRELLIGRHLVDMVISTESYYEKCRTTLLRTRLLKGLEFCSEDESNSLSSSNNYLSGEEKRLLKSLNYENFDYNGLKNYACYQIFDKKFIDDLSIEWRQEFIFQQMETRKRFSEVVAFEEEKFKKWKVALQEKQDKLTGSLDSLRQSVESLQLECHALERRLINKVESI